MPSHVSSTIRLTISPGYLAIHSTPIRDYGGYLENDQKSISMSGSPSSSSLFLSFLPLGDLKPSPSIRTTVFGPRV